MKLKILTRITVLAILVISASAVFVSTPGNAFVEIYPTGGIQQEKHNFGWDETPWIYLLLPNPNELLFRSEVYTEWYYSVEGNARGVKSGSGWLKKSYSLRLDNWTSPGVRAAGHWTVFANFAHYDNDGHIIGQGTGSTTFTVHSPSNVVPEPASLTLLFLILAALVLQQERQTKHSV